MGKDSKTLNTVYHIFFFPNVVLLFWSIRAHLAKIFFIACISASSHIKPAAAQYLKLDMCKLTCQESRK